MKPSTNKIPCFRIISRNGKSRIFKKRDEPRRVAYITLGKLIRIFLFFYRSQFICYIMQNMLQISGKVVA